MMQWTRRIGSVAETRRGLIGDLVNEISVASTGTTPVEFTVTVPATASSRRTS